MTMLQGDLRGGDNNAKNVLVRDTGTADFTATVTLDNRPASFAIGAGLLIYWDDNSYTALLRSNNGSPQIMLANEVNGGLSEWTVADPTSGPLTLRLQRAGTAVTASFSQDKASWSKVINNPATNNNFDSATELKVGVIAQKGFYNSQDQAISFSGFTLNDQAVPFFG
jgi:regulation of enolase protein 1 (concanavalin A-like superfamily)